MISLQADMFFLFFVMVWYGGHACLAWSLLRPLRTRPGLRRSGWLLLAGATEFTSIRLVRT
jgi:hypothetical protein